MKDITLYRIDRTLHMCLSIRELIYKLLSFTPSQRIVYNSANGLTSLAVNPYFNTAQLKFSAYMYLNKLYHCLSINFDQGNPKFNASTTVNIGQALHPSQSYS